MRKVKEYEIKRYNITNLLKQKDEKLTKENLNSIRIVYGNPNFKECYWFTSNISPIHIIVSKDGSIAYAVLNKKCSPSNVEEMLNEIKSLPERKDLYEKVLRETGREAMEKNLNEQQTATLFLKKARGLYLKKMKPDKKEKCITYIPETNLWLNDGWEVYKNMPQPYPLDRCLEPLQVESFRTDNDCEEYHFCYITEPLQEELSDFICTYINIDVEDYKNTPYVMTYRALGMKDNTPMLEWNALANLLKAKAELIKCPRCGKLKPASEFTFRDSECRECVQELLSQPPVWQRNKR